MNKDFHVVGHQHLCIFLTLLLNSSIKDFDFVDKVTGCLVLSTMTYSTRQLITEESCEGLWSFFYDLNYKTLKPTLNS
ncbi:hypothetical protein VIGAN_01340700 [Vigna angularis var. angularis]|uniref:Uncharacterized protein n=1 Tax=Vigna angularis var. angularis TaxID=157739 RepID=A0A0S3R4Y7_PHAAN|nr:hypothetical protein VIGAN_01340700 [Vigna angularis var. angularis]